MRQALYQLAGFDLTTIDGIGVDTTAVVISELGLDFSAFPDEGHFVSYLRLAPNLSFSAGKKVPSKLKGTTTSRVATALRMAALALRNSKTALGAFYRRISKRKGASVAVFATARKLAQIIYTEGVPYQGICLRGFTYKNRVRLPPEVSPLPSKYPVYLFIFKSLPCGGSHLFSYLSHLASLNFLFGPSS